MATIRKEILTRASAAKAWDAMRDVGALHTRLVRGFVTNTTLEDGVRIVTFVNGMTARERIVDIDDKAMRLVWTIEGSPQLAHHNGATQIFPDGDGAKIVWIADILPNETAPAIDGMMEHGAKAMKATLDAQA